MDAKQVLKMVRGKTWLFEDAVLRVIERAIDKTIPKKVVIAKILHSGSSPMLCPECKARVYAYQDYCPACGQALDWEVE